MAEFRFLVRIFVRMATEDDLLRLKKALLKVSMPAGVTVELSAIGPGTLIGETDPATGKGYDWKGAAGEVL